MPQGGGAGASTAGLMARARAAGASDTALITDACLAIEGASDPLLVSHAERILWASRQGQVLTQMPALPRYDIIGGFSGPGQRTDPQDHDFPHLSDLVTAWQSGASLADFAGLASQSAQRTLALRGPKADLTAALAGDLGALGHVIAHTGSARGLIFAPGSVPETASADLRRAGFSRITRWRGGG